MRVMNYAWPSGRLTLQNLLILDVMYFFSQVLSYGRFQCSVLEIDVCLIKNWLSVIFNFWLSYYVCITEMIISTEWTVLLNFAKWMFAWLCQISIQGKNLCSGDVVNTVILTCFQKFNCFKFGTMLETTKLYTLLPVWTILSFVSYYSCMGLQELLHLFSHKFLNWFWYNLVCCQNC